MWLCNDFCPDFFMNLRWAMDLCGKKTAYNIQSSPKKKNMVRWGQVSNCQTRSFYQFGQLLVFFLRVRILLYQGSCCSFGYFYFFNPRPQLMFSCISIYKRFLVPCKKVKKSLVHITWTSLKNIVGLCLIPSFVTHNWDLHRSLYPRTNFSGRTMKNC